MTKKSLKYDIMCSWWESYGSYWNHRRKPIGLLNRICEYKLFVINDWLFDNLLCKLIQWDLKQNLNDSYDHYHFTHIIKRINENVMLSRDAIGNTCLHLLTDVLFMEMLHKQRRNSMELPLKRTFNTLNDKISNREFESLEDSNNMHNVKASNKRKEFVEENCRFDTSIQLGINTIIENLVKLFYLGSTTLNIKEMRDTNIWNDVLNFDEKVSKVKKKPLQSSDFKLNDSLYDQLKDSKELHKFILLENSLKENMLMKCVGNGLLNVVWKVLNCGIYMNDKSSTDYLLSHSHQEDDEMKSLLNEFKSQLSSSIQTDKQNDTSDNLTNRNRKVRYKRRKRVIKH